MMEKRFELNNIVKKGTVSFWDTKKQKVLNASHSLDLLNELHEEIEYLKPFANENTHYIADMEDDIISFKQKIEKLEKENEELRKDLIDHSALISMLEDYQALKIEETLWNLTGAKSEEEFNELYKPYLEKAKRCWR